MPITEIHPITATIASALAYCSGHKIECDKDSSLIPETTRFYVNDHGETVFQTMTSLLNVERAPHDESGIAKDFSERIRTYSEGTRMREDGKQNIAFHIVQSFDEYVNPVIAHEIGVKFAKELYEEAGYQVQISTHTNTDHIHNHIIISAWDEHGKKYHDCNSSYRLIRQVSDRISQEYGVGILEATKNYKPVGRKGQDGKWHQYEPTDRKNKAIQERANQETSKDGIGCYRNTIAYERTVKDTETQREAVRQDIEEIIPRCESYEQLLRLLREEKGYSISDKKKNGEWLQYVTFTHPLYSKGVRDKSLADDGSYMRVSLEQRIAEQILKKDIEFLMGEKSDSNHETCPEKHAMNRYHYTSQTVASINREYRIYEISAGYLKKRRRGDPEQEVIRHIQFSHAELSQLIDTSALDSMIKSTELEAKYGKRWITTHEEKHCSAIIKDIQSGFQVLEFLEDKGLATYEEMTKAYQSVTDSYQQMMAQVSENEAVLKKLEQALEYPAMIQELQRKITENSNNTEYQLEQLPIDQRRLIGMQKTVRNLRIDTQNGMTELAQKIVHYISVNEGIKQTLSSLESEAGRFKTAYEYLKRIDGRNGLKHSCADIPSVPEDNQKHKKKITKKHRDRDR